MVFRELEGNADSSSVTLLFNGSKVDSNDLEAASDNRELLSERRRATSLTGLRWLRVRDT